MAALWTAALATTLTALLGALATPAHAWEPETLPEELTRFARHADSLLAIAPLMLLQQHEPWLSDERVDELLTGAVGLARHPDVRLIAQYQYLRHLVGTGRFEQARALERELAFLEDWAIAGPFPNDGMSGFDVPYGPETEGYRADLGPWPGAVVPVSWRTLERATETGYVDLSEFVSPHRGVVIYGLTTFDSPRARDAVLSLAVDGAYRVWLNGEPVGIHETHVGGFAVRDEVPVRLRRGENTLLIKVATEQTAAGWHARVVDAQGRPVVPASRVPARAVPPVRRSDRGAFTRVTTLVDRLDAERASAAWGPRELAMAAMVAMATQWDDPDEPWNRYADEVPVSEVGREIAQYLLPTRSAHWQRMELVRAALERDPGLETGLMLHALLLEELAMDSQQAADRLLAALIESYPHDPRLAGAHARRLINNTFYRGALADLEATRELAGDVPGWRVQAIRAFRQLGRRHEAGWLAQPERLRRGTDLDLQLEWIAHLRAHGDHDGAEARLAELEAFAGGRAGYWLVLAAAREATGDAAGQVDALRRAAQLAPDDVYVRSSLAAAALLAGQNEEAIDELRGLIERRPQDQSIRELLATVEGAQDRFHEEFRVGLDELRELRRERAEREDYTVVARQRVVHMYPNGLATTWVQMAWDVHSRTGADQLRALHIGYQAGVELVDVLRVQILKADGSVREVYSSNDFGPPGGPQSMYVDVRTRALQFPALEAGDLLNVEYTIANVSYQNMFDDYFGDLWFVNDNVPVTLARYGLLAPGARQVHDNAASLAGLGTWTVEQRGDQTLRLFEARDLPAVPRESRGPGPSERWAYLHLSTYREADVLANWYWNLIREQLVRSPEMEDTVRQLIAGVDDRREQVARIHEYVVRTTRYVGLEFGIHGFKPYRTTECFTRRFGDCKDTASLIKVMLGIAGIDAHLVLVRTRDLGRVDGGPPSLAMFNHAIVWVPEFDLYLDGTAGFSGSAELPGPNQGATAMIVLDGRGARTLTLPWLPAAQNTLTTTLELDARDPDAPHGTLTMRYQGQEAASLRRSFESPERRRDEVEQWLARQVQGATVPEVSFSDLSRIEEPVVIEATVRGGAWLRDSGGALIMPPLARRAIDVSTLAPTSERATPRELGPPALWRHEVRVLLPDGFTPERLPEPQVFESAFGRLVLTQTLDGGVYTAVGELRVDAPRVDPDRWSDLRSWTREMDAALNRPVRLVRAETALRGER